MEPVERYFEKAQIIFEYLKAGNAVPIDTIKSELNVSRTIAINALNEFNMFEKTVVFCENDCVRFLDKKESLSDCTTYKVFEALIQKMLSDPEYYLFSNEINVAQELGIDRKVLQKMKTLVKLSIK